MRLSMLVSMVLLLLLSPCRALSEEMPGLNASSGTTALLEEPKFLPVDEAFQLTASIEGKVIVLRWQVMPGYYLYRHRLGFEAAGAELGEPRIPAGEQKYDEYFGAVEVYHDELSVSLPIDKGRVEELDLSVSYQGCADAGLCYPPQKRTVLGENL
ncbi:MAG: hypothetical protein HUJ31_16490 [Pseudomonadales bacterium]|nr:hypothetical protein [Pseudomonadales bacterium]